MLKTLRSAQATLRLNRPRWNRARAAVASISTPPRPPLDLDPSYEALLDDMDMSLTRHKRWRRPSAAERPGTTHRELDVLPFDPSLEVAHLQVELQSEESGDAREARKSPAALFGSKGFGTLEIPEELQMQIKSLIAGVYPTTYRKTYVSFSSMLEHDRTQLHSDALRLFTETDEKTGQQKWDTEYDIRYGSRKQAAIHHDRDGTAFATVALPAHFSAIYSVLSHLKHRLGPDWKANNVIDWGAGTGSGLW